jgi:hypothetical protein
MRYADVTIHRPGKNPGLHQLRQLERVSEEVPPAQWSPGRPARLPFTTAGRAARGYVFIALARDAGTALEQAEVATQS